VQLVLLSPDNVLRIHRKDSQGEIHEMAAIALAYELSIPELMEVVSVLTTLTDPPPPPKALKPPAEKASSKPKKAKRIKNDWLDSRWLVGWVNGHPGHNTNVASEMICTALGRGEGSCRGIIASRLSNMKIKGYLEQDAEKRWYTTQHGIDWITTVTPPSQTEPPTTEDPT
jgi:hypothetical protein